MACGVPQIVPRWSALAELAEPAAVFINCPTTAVTSGGCNVIGGVPDVDQIVEELDFLYRSPERRAELSRKGLQHVRSAKFNWPAIGRQFTEMLEGVISKRGAKHEARSEAHV
jgi:glycosyltransferase involved in cell wall biosynthesis